MKTKIMKTIRKIIAAIIYYPLYGIFMAFTYLLEGFAVFIGEQLGSGFLICLTLLILSIIFSIFIIPLAIFIEVVLFIAVVYGMIAGEYALDEESTYTLIIVGLSLILISVFLIDNTVIGRGLIGLGMPLLSAGLFGLLYKVPK